VSGRILLSGATGFIGASVARVLAGTGRKVTALVRTGSDVRRLESMGNVEQILCDWNDDPETISMLRDLGPSTFIHCAWRGVAGRQRNEEFHLTENVSLTLRSVDLANAVGCAQWIGVGSQAEYGNQNRCLGEDAPLRPTTKYGEAKKIAGIEALTRCGSVGMIGAWVRVFSTYGPDDSPEWFIPYVVGEFLAGRAPKLTRCEQLWDYLYVDDAAQALVALADASAGGVFNLGSGNAKPLRTFVEAARNEVRTDVMPEYGAIPYRLDQVMHLEADISRLVAATGWQPRVDIQEGMRATVAFERQRAEGSSTY
jgi:UDP-glucose 4-epimerase